MLLRIAVVLPGDCFGDFRHQKKDLAKSVKGVWDAVVLDNYTIQQW